MCTEKQHEVNPLQFIAENWDTASFKRTSLQPLRRPLMFLMKALLNKNSQIFSKGAFLTLFG